MENTGKNVRIDTYDFFGYLAPGAVAFFGIVMFCLGFLTTEDLVHFGDRITAVVGSKGWFSTLHYATAIVAVIVLCYMIGHIVATLSSLVLERILVAKIFEYPFQRILFDKKSKFSGTPLHYRTLIVGIYLALFTFLNSNWIYDYVTSSSIHKYVRENWFELPQLPIGCFWLSCFIFWLACKWLYLPMEKHASKEGGINNILCLLYVKFFDAYCWIFSLPLILLEIIFSSFMGIHTGMPKEVVKKIKEKFKEEFDVDPTPEMKSELFWAIYLYVINRSQTMRIRIEKFLTLYGFMRSMSIACYIVSLLLSVVVVNSDSNIVFSKKIYVWTCYLFGVFSIVFMLRYYYLYNNYFSKTILRVFVFSSEDERCICPQVNAESQ